MAQQAAAARCCTRDGGLPSGQQRKSAWLLLLSTSWADRLGNVGDGECYLQPLSALQTMSGMLCMLG